MYFFVKFEYYFNMNNMKPKTDPYDTLESNQFYHIYNRGINSCNVFYEEKNYLFFLQKYALYLSPYVDTYAYCLLKNHFHILIKVKDKSTIETLIQKKNFQKSGLHSVEHVISKQFAKLFSSYTQSFNKVYTRTGSLFEAPFKRKLITSEKYLENAIRYIHQNAQYHGLVKDYKEYRHSSYHSFLSEKASKLANQEVLNFYSSETDFVQNHTEILKENNEWSIED